MDYGHYNCRDYYISPHFAPTTITNKDRPPLILSRHESWQQLEERSRSSRSQQPKFPLLKLPLELRQQIFSYLLPKTLVNKEPSPLANHARTFNAVLKRGAKGMPIPQPDPIRRAASNHVVWQRGCIDLLQVCHQLHDECAELLYGLNTFLLFATYSGITFRFSWLNRSGSAPFRTYNILHLLSPRYLSLIRRVLLNVDMVDEYTGMIKYNVSSRQALAHGLRSQLRRLVDALQMPLASIDTAGEPVESRPEPLAKVSIRVFSAIDGIRKRSGSSGCDRDLVEVLEPLGELRGVREASISGSVSRDFAQSLEQKMMGMELIDQSSKALHHLRDIDRLSSAATPYLCVYGNDL